MTCQTFRIRKFTVRRVHLRLNLSNCSSQNWRIAYAGVNLLEFWIWNLTKSSSTWVIFSFRLNHSVWTHWESTYDLQTVHFQLKLIKFNWFITENDFSHFAFCYPISYCRVFCVAGTTLESTNIELSSSRGYFSRLLKRFLVGAAEKICCSCRSRKGIHEDQLHGRPPDYFKPVHFLRHLPCSDCTSAQRRASFLIMQCIRRFFRCSGTIRKYESHGTAEHSTNLNWFTLDT